MTKFLRTFPKSWAESPRKQITHISEVEVSISNLLKILADLLTNSYGIWHLSQISKSFHLVSPWRYLSFLYYGLLGHPASQLSDDFSKTSGFADYPAFFCCCKRSLFKYIDSLSNFFFPCNSFVEETESGRNTLGFANCVFFVSPEFPVNWQLNPVNWQFDYSCIVFI